VTIKVLVPDAAGTPPSMRDYFYFSGAVRGMAVETMGDAVEMYVEALGLRFAVPLIEFFGAGLGVDEDYLPAATRDGMDPAALRLGVVDGTQVATAGSEDNEIRDSSRGRRPTAGSSSARFRAPRRARRAVGLGGRSNPRGELRPR